MPAHRLLFFLFALTLLSCGPNFVFQESHPIAEEQWTYADSLAFEVGIDDTLSRYNFYLDIEHRDSYPYQNLYLRIGTRYPNGQQLKKALSINLADKIGQWNGKCSGDLCKVRVNLQEKVYFNEVGTYRFVFEQFTRQDSLGGIKQIGFKVEDIGTLN